MIAAIEALHCICLPGRPVNIVCPKHGTPTAQLDGLSNFIDEINPDLHDDCALATDLEEKEEELKEMEKERDDLKKQVEAKEKELEAFDAQLVELRSGDVKLAELYDWGVAQNGERAIGEMMRYAPGRLGDVMVSVLREHRPHIFVTEKQEESIKAKVLECAKWLHGEAELAKLKGASLKTHASRVSHLSHAKRLAEFAAALNTLIGKKEG